MSNNSIVVSSIPLKGLAVAPDRKESVGVLVRNNDRSNIVVYDNEGRNVVRTIDSVLSSQQISFPDILFDSRVISLKGAIFVSCCNREGYKKEELKAYHHKTHKLMYRIPLSLCLDWDKGFRVADSTRLENGINIICCIQENDGFNDRVVVLRYSETDEQLEIIDIAEARTGSFANLSLNNDGRGFTTDLVERTSYNSPFYLSSFHYSFKIDESKNKISIIKKEKSYNYDNFVRNNNIAVTVRKPVMQNRGSITIKNNKTGKIIFYTVFQSLYGYNIQAIEYLRILILQIKSETIKNYIVSYDDNKMDIIFEFVGEVLNFERRDDYIQIETQEKTLLVEGDRL